MLDRLVLKENEVFAVTGSEGNIRASPAEGQGLYFRDTRFLSTYEFSIDGVPLQLLSSAGELNFMSNLQLGNGPSKLQSGVEIPARTLSVRRNRFIDGGLDERIGLLNYNAFPVTVTVRLTFGSDFRDMFDVRGYAGQAPRGTVKAPEHRGHLIRLRYEGLDKVSRTTQIRFSQEPDHVHLLSPEAQEGIDHQRAGSADPRGEVGPPPPGAQAIFTATLLPQEPWSLSVRIVPVLGPESTLAGPVPSIDKSFQRILDAHTQWEAACTRITTDHELLNALIGQSLHDLRLTINRGAHGLVPVGGIPWFAVPFGRDSLITSLQTLCLNPDIAYGTLRFLARYQGKAVDPTRDEEPGKIFHELRGGEIATLGEVPYIPYFGSVDSTPLFVYVFTELLKWTGDWVLAADLRPHLEQALEWIRVYGDRDGDGLVEYKGSSPKGIRNQGWKDSSDSIMFPDGRVPEPPIAVAEVQGYAYAAEAQMAEVYRGWGDTERAELYRSYAARRSQRFEEAFWLEDEQFYALALDARKVPIPAVSSNPGHCLLMGMLEGPRADALVDRLMQEDMLSGWGIRTLSSKYPTFNPMSYHNGAIWPHDNSLVAAGLRRSGYGAAALRVMEEMFQAGFELPGYRLPELFCGFSRDRRYQSAPAAYPLSCAPQAWAAGGVFLMLQHLVGLELDLLRGHISLRPMLLPWINELHMENLRVGRRRLAIHVWRAGAEVRAEVRGAEGLEVAIR